MPDRDPVPGSIALGLGVRIVPAALVLAACHAGTGSTGAAGAGGFELAGFRQGGQLEVALNETLVLHFTEDLDPASVTSASVRILSAGNVEARGELSVQRSRLEFAPDLPLRADLADAGLQPATSYRIELAGFPRPDGLRSRVGRVLARTYVLAFRTVTADDVSSPFHETVEARPWLGPEQREIGPLGPILLASGEALDPRSLDAAAFELRGFGSAAEPGEGLERIPLQVRLAENHVDRAVLELRPLADATEEAAYRALDPGKYFLWIDPSREALRTLGGIPVQPVWGANLTIELRVLGPRTGELVETFDDERRRSPQPWPGSDGTAAWGDGAVRVRFPAAAGSGRDGPVRLGATEGRADVQATTIELPEGTTCELTAEGPVVLRAQRSIELAGGLRRRVEGAPMGWDPGESLEAWSQRTWREEAWRIPSMAADFGPPGEPAADGPEALSAWLARVQERGLPWTILIAGGDLQVVGSLECDGPLLVVAGGWVRVFGRVTAREVWRLGSGGGSFQPPEVEAPLDVDPPLANPLVEPLRLTALSDRIRPPYGVVRWRSAERRGDAGAGTISMRFLGERDDGPRTEVFGPVSDLGLLEGCQAIRFVLELEVPPARSSGGPWTPPRVDEVRIVWDEPPRGRATGR